MKRTLLMIAAAAVLSSAQAATITLTNGDFQSSGNGTNPSGWTTVEDAAGYVYVYALGGGIPAGTNVLAFHARDDNSVAQQFSSAEALTGDFTTYTVTFDSGWRNNTNAPNDLTLTFELVNFTTNSLIDSDTYVFPANSPSNAFDNYRVIATGNTVTLTDDFSTIGDNIGLRIVSSSSRNSFDPTGWIDNVSIEAVPEPSSTALLGLACLGLLIRRRA